MNAGDSEGVAPSPERNPSYLRRGGAERGDRSCSGIIWLHQYSTLGLKWHRWSGTGVESDRPSSQMHYKHNVFNDTVRPCFTPLNKDQRVTLYLKREFLMDSEVSNGASPDLSNFTLDLDS